MSNMNRSFAQRDNHVEISTTVEKEKLDSKQVMDTIAQFEAEIAKVDGQIVQIDAQKAKNQQIKEGTINLCKRLRKFEDWASNLQKAKLRALIVAITEECKEKAITDLKEDPALTKEQNGRQRYQRFQHALATHARTAEEIHSEYIKLYIFENPIFDDPFQ